MSCIATCRLNCRRYDIVSICFRRVNYKIRNSFLNVKFTIFWHVPMRVVIIMLNEIDWKLKPFTHFRFQLVWTDDWLQLRFNLTLKLAFNILQTKKSHYNHQIVIYYREGKYSSIFRVFIKNKNRSSLTDSDLNGLMISAKTNRHPNTQKLASNIQPQNPIWIFRLHSKI